MGETRPAIYFIRHGETDWNFQRRIQGQTDTPLNATGRAQAAALAAKLVGLFPDPADARFCCSPLARSRQTMEAILSAYGLAPERLEIEHRLVELGFGIWEGRTWPEITVEAGIDLVNAAEAYHDWRSYGGESYADATARVADWLASLTRPAVAVSHGGISRIVRGLALGLPKREIVQLPVPQDRFFRIEGQTIEWFDARTAPA